MHTTTTTTTRRPSISTLPTEILDIILSDLERHHIAACVLVNQEWFDLFSPYLWRYIHFNNNNTAQPLRHWAARKNYDENDPESRFLLRLMRGIEAGALVRNGQWIQNIDCRIYEIARLLAVYGESCTNLLSLRIGISFNIRSFPSSDTAAAGGVNTGGRKGGRDCEPSVDLSPLIAILERNPRLRKLAIERAMLNGRDPDHGRLMDSIPASIEDLEFAYWDPIYYSQRIRSELEEEGDKDGDESGQQEQRPFSMHTTSSCDVHGNSSSRTTPKSPTAALLPNLKRLSFKSHALTHQKQTLHQLLVRCPNLETVQLYDNPKIVPLRLFSLLLRQHCPKLQDLFVMHDLRNFSDEELRDVLDASTAGWRSLGFPRAPHESHEFDSLSIAALLRHAGTIENLRIDGCDCLTSATIQQILCSAPKLKRFDTLLMDRSRRADIELKAADIIAGKPWVCTELESLKIRIVGVSRPDLVKRSNGRPLDGPLHRGSMEESRRIQRVIYEQLGRLTSLKQLILGHDEVEVDHICRNYEKATEGRYFNEGGPIQRGHQYECLEMTLESGMDAMSGLKELRVLELGAMEVGKMDQGWVKKNWPMLGSPYKDTFWTDLGYREYA